MNRRKGLLAVVAVSCAAVLPLLMGQGCPNGAGLGLPGGGDLGYTNVTPAEANALIQAHQGDPNFVILDVRDPDEFAGGHIEGAINVCLNCVSSFAESVTDFDKAKTYLVYCRSGRRSATASGIMAAEGFQNVYNMTGGITAWQVAGLPAVQ
jgi:phage shock protein E